MITRPLTGEPLPLDLANTTWVIAGQHYDALADPEFVASWASSHDERYRDAPAATAALVAARTAIRAALPTPRDPADYDALNALLARGRIRDRVDADGPASVVEVDDPDERLAWRAAHEFVDLLRTHPRRIKPCHGCILWFLDTTRSGTRRWCSMEACGNRAKVRRHRGT